MSVNARKHSSNWDLKEESRNSFENLGDHAWTGKVGAFFLDKKSSHGWGFPVSSVDHRKWPAREPVSGRRNLRRDDDLDEDHNRALKAVSTWDEDELRSENVSWS